jgi:hypothetical protein
MEELALLEIEDDSEDFEEFWLWRARPGLRTLWGPHFSGPHRSLARPGV